MQARSQVQLILTPATNVKLCARVSHQSGSERQKLKKHILIIGWLYIVMSAIGIALSMTLCVSLWLDSSVRSQTGLQFLGPPVLVFACLGLAPGLISGVGLLYRRNWARMILLIFSAILLPMLPVGTAIGVYGFWTLLNAETQALFAGSFVPETRNLRPNPCKSSPLLNLFGVMVSVAAGFFLTLKVGFIVHHEPQPAVIASTALTAAAAFVILVAAIASTVILIRIGGRAASDRRNPGYTTNSTTDLRQPKSAAVSQSGNEWSAEVVAQGRINAQLASKARVEEQRRRVEELAADPARAQYAPLVKRGEDWSDQNIAYYENHEIAVSCEHLQPIERAMRRAGIDARRHLTNVSAKCLIDLPALKIALSPPPTVRYMEYYQDERYERENPAAFLICDEHKSIIHTVHPEAAVAKEMPWFPPSRSL